MQNELTAERIELAIKEIADVGMYGSQVHQETMETALAALRAEQERLNQQPLTWKDLADDELRQTLFLLDWGHLNEGLRQVYSNKADWLIALQRALGVRK